MDLRRLGRRGRAKEEPLETRSVWSTRGNGRRCDSAGSTLTVEKGLRMRIAGKKAGAGVVAAESW